MKYRIKPTRDGYFLVDCTQKETPQNDDWVRFGTYTNLDLAKGAIRFSRDFSDNSVYECFVLDL